MISSLWIKRKSITPIVGAWGPTSIPMTMRNGIIENFNLPEIIAASATSKRAVPTSKTKWSKIYSPPSFDSNSLIKFLMSVLPPEITSVSPASIMVSGPGLTRFLVSFFV